MCCFTVRLSVSAQVEERSRGGESIKSSYAHKALKVSKARHFRARVSVVCQAELAGATKSSSAQQSPLPQDPKGFCTGNVQSQSQKVKGRDWRDARELGDPPALLILCEEPLDVLLSALLAESTQLTFTLLDGCLGFCSALHVLREYGSCELRP